ncbi:MAG: InlB B-repeat-containing protein, partial [Lachnospiraceae bacterium]|nr:InlB B-repeat-containing protein [Lachnospiraceae bacterium]
HGGKLSGVVGDSYTKTYSRLSDVTLETEVYKDGQRFDGWYTEEDGQGTKYDVIPKSENIVEDITLHAHYINTRYKVTYMLNGGELIGKTLTASGSYVVTYDNRETVNLFTKNDIKHEGSEFFRWEDKNGNAYQKIEEGNTEDLELYAQYSSETVDIIFNIGKKGKAKGKVAKDGKFTQTYNLSSTMVLPTELSWTEVKRNKQTGKTYEEYYFDGWYENSNCTGKPITTIPAGNPKKIQELYAKWTLGSYKIVYHMNRGYIAGLSKNERSDESTEEAAKLEEYELPTVLYRASSEFLGWYEKSNTTGNAITKLTKNPKQIDKNNEVHLYAKWKASKYYVTYVTVKRDYTEDSEGTYAKYTSTLNVDNQYPYVLQDETNNFGLTELGEEYAFDGWYKNQEFTGDEVISINANATSDEVVYAKLVKRSEHLTSTVSVAEYNAKKEARDKKR